jgi:aspartyl protease family protein
MSKTLRLSVIAVMLLSSTALSIIAYNALNPPPPPPPPAQPEPEPPHMARPRVSRLPRIIEKLIPAEPTPKPSLAQIAECIKIETARYQNQIRFAALANPISNSADASERHIRSDMMNDVAAAMRAAIQDKCNGPSASPSDKPPPQTVRVAMKNEHYFPRVTINGRPVNVMADTGASLVSLTDADAKRAGIDCNPPTAQRTRFNTANGPREDVVFLLPEITIEGMALRNVEASCGTKSDVSLLGMSALKRFNVRMRSDGWLELSKPN